MNINAKRIRVVMAMSAILVLVGTRRASADSMVGFRVGYYTDVEEPFIGGELLFRVAPLFYFNPNLEYVFVENARYLTANADFHFDFPSKSKVFAWIGAGLGVVSINPEGRARTRNDAAGNFLLGVGFSRGPVIPYGQLKFIAKRNSELALGFGLRF